MNNKKLILATVGIILTWGGWLIYRNNRNNKIDSTPVSYEEALKKLEKI
jgi:predicted negative regulator of RcsB-dependent stress response